MRKRMLAMLLACCLIGGTLSGCGGKTENSKENSQASAETEKTEQEDTSGEKEQPENITIEFFNQKQEEAAQQAYRNAAEDFHKEYPYTPHRRVLRPGSEAQNPFRIHWQKPPSPSDRS